MKFNSLSELVRASKNDSLNNNDNIFYNRTTNQFYTKGRFASAISRVINYLGETMLNIDEELPNFCRSLKLRKIITSYQARHTTANDVLSIEYNMPNKSNNLLTGKTLKDFIITNELKEDEIPYETGVLSLTFDKHDITSTKTHISGLIKREATIKHIEHDLNLINQKNKTKLLNRKNNGRYLLTDILIYLNGMIKKEGKMTQWQQDVIHLFVKHSKSISNVDNSRQSTLTRAVNDNYHKDIILYLIELAPTDSLNLQAGESYSVLDKALDKAKNDTAYIDILEAIVNKGIDLDLPIDDAGNKADINLIKKLLPNNKLVNPDPQD